MRVSGIRVFVPIVLSFVPPFLTALEIPNWTVPPYRSTGASGGLTTMTDVTQGIAFVGIQPCRVADTRGNGAPIQGGILANSALRTWDVTNICGIPAGADAISVNFTVVAAGGIPAGSFLLAWPTGQPPPPTAIMTYGPGQIISNAAVVPLGPSEQLNVNVSGSTHIVMDVNGYFSNVLNAGNQFVVAASIAATGAIHGTNTSGVDLSAGVRGDSTAGRTFGVWGETSSTTQFAGGVVGVASSTTGLAVGTWGQTASNTNGAIGVFGDTLSTTGTNYGVYGLSRSNAANSAGVFGVDGSGVTAAIGVSSTGVRGESLSGSGVVGFTGPAGITGVIGAAVGANGFPVAIGYLGLQGTTDYGVFSIGDTHVAGTFTATTNKGFVQPHPFDASKEIRYISLEGPHTEVYFRGTAQVSQGVTRISIPQHFRFVADPATYSTLVTPVGTMATVAVLSEGEGGIVVQASRNVKIHYVVYAEREAVRNPDPIIENVHFRPEPDRDFLAHLPDSFRELLIQNGTLNSDGTVNMETARRLGWDKEWEKRGRPAPQPATD